MDKINRIKYEKQLYELWKELYWQDTFNQDIEIEKEKERLAALTDFELIAEWEEYFGENPDL